MYVQERRMNPSVVSSMFCYNKDLHTTDHDGVLEIPPHKFCVDGPKIGSE